MKLWKITSDGEDRFLEAYVWAPTKEKASTMITRWVGSRKFFKFEIHEAIVPKTPYILSTHVTPGK